MGSNGSAWPQLNELQRELEERAASPEASAEPSLTEATLAASKAASALSRAAAGRGRGREDEAALSHALDLVEEARRAIAQARLAIAAAAARWAERERRAGQEPSGRALAAVEGDVEAACPSCGHGFVVRYRATGAHPLVAFPISCPIPQCDGTVQVEYPEGAFSVDVQALRS